MEEKVLYAGIDVAKAKLSYSFAFNGILCRNVIRSATSASAQSRLMYLLLLTE